jgi:hypothetical protein
MPLRLTCKFRLISIKQGACQFLGHAPEQRNCKGLGHVHEKSLALGWSLALNWCTALVHLLAMRPK